MRTVLAVIVAYIGSRAIFAAFDFNYAVFSEPFNVGKLIIDFGVFMALFGGCIWLLGLKGTPETKDAS
ncbi:MAG: hypothetical protein KAH56_04015 [Candidatus Krumholzibacteria bacterium]|nr:hypothetical protein [Candidatus Krumholzibacteria bacterium]